MKEYYFKSENRIVVRKVGELQRISSALDFQFVGNDLYVLEYYSYRHGIVKINFETKLITGNVWETQEKAQSASVVNYHYTGFFLSGHLTEDNKNEILNFVIEDLDDYKIESLILKKMGKSTLLLHIQNQYKQAEFV